MDADLSHNPEYLPALAAAAATHDVVIGSRYLNGVSVVNWPLHRIFLSTFANRYIRAVTQLSPTDCTSGFRCWRREALARLPLDAMVSDGYAFLVEMLFDAHAARLPHRRGADHLRRAAAGPVEAVLERAARVAHHAVAPQAARARAADHAPRRRDGDDVVSRGSRGQRRHVHGADRRNRSPRAATRCTSSRRGIRSSTRAQEERGVHFHFYRYAPLRSLNVFGYAAAHARRRQPARRRLRGRAARARGRLARGAARRAATSGDGHARPLGDARRRHRRRRGAARCRSSSACTAPTSTSPRRFAPARLAARRAFRPRRVRDRVQRRSRAPRDRARRRSARRIETVPYGVDVARFRPRPGSARGAAARARRRRRACRSCFAAGRLVRKKGFEYLIDALAPSAARPSVLAIAGDGDLRGELRERARAAGVADRVRFLGNLPQDRVGALPRRRRRRRRAVGARRQRQRRRAAQHRAGGAGVGHAARRDGRRRHRHGGRGRPDRR